MAAADTRTELSALLIAFCISLIQLLLLLHPFNSLFSRTTWVSRYQKGKTSLDLNEARDYRVSGCNGISWSICKQSAPCSVQITTPTPHHLIFLQTMLFLMPKQQCQSTVGNITDTTTHTLKKALHNRKRTAYMHWNIAVCRITDTVTAHFHDNVLAKYNNFLCAVLQSTWITCEHS